MTAGEKSTVIGRSMEVRGEITGGDDLWVEGEVEGTVTLPEAKLTVGVDGRVRATILAKDVLVLGFIEGEIRATGLLELRSGAKVTGEIFAQRLSIEEGAVLHAKLDPTRASEAASKPGPQISRKISQLHEELDLFLEKSPGAVEKTA